MDSAARIKFGKELQDLIMFSSQNINVGMEVCPYKLFVPILNNLLVSKIIYQPRRNSVELGYGGLYIRVTREQCSN